MKIEVVFPGPLRIEDRTATVPGRIRPLVALLEPFPVFLSLDGVTGVLTVPEGFLSDLASVPGPFWRWFPPFGPWNAASVLHDYLCQFRGRVDWPWRISSTEAAGIMFEGMASTGVPWWRRQMIYKAVRWFGPQWEGESDGPP